VEPDDYSEMIGEMPALVRGGIADLAELGGPKTALITGLILMWRDRLVFAYTQCTFRLGPPSVPLGAQDRDDIAAFVGIGN